MADLTHTDDATWLTGWQSLIADPSTTIESPSEAISAHKRRSTLVEQLARNPDSVLSDESPRPPNAGAVADALSDAVVLTTPELRLLGKHPDTDRLHPSLNTVRTSLAELMAKPTSRWTIEDRHSGNLILQFSNALPEIAGEPRESYVTALTPYDSLRIAYGLDTVSADLDIVIAQAIDEWPVETE